LDRTIANLRQAHTEALQRLESELRAEFESENSKLRSANAKLAAELAALRDSGTRKPIESASDSVDADDALAMLSEIRDETGGKSLAEALANLKRLAEEAKRMRSSTGTAAPENVAADLSAASYVRRLRQQMYAAWLFAIASFGFWFIR
jgi:flagellar motor switch protein FliG